MVHRFFRNRLAVVGLVLVILFIMVGLTSPLLASHDPNEQHLDKTFTPPGAEFWLGTDHLGRDIFIRLIHASRVSLVIAFGATALGLSSGTAVGVLAGYSGGWVDNLIMRAIDILLSFPGILLALAIVSAVGPGVKTLILAVGISSAPIFTRVVRGAVLRIKTEEYVLAAEALGARPMRVMWVHIVPNCIGPIVIQTTLRFADVIIVAAGLSFLGLGVPPAIPEWGSMLADGRVYLRTASWIAVAPGVTIMLVVLAFNLLGDGLQDALYPRFAR